MSMTVDGERTPRALVEHIHSIIVNELGPAFALVDSEGRVLHTGGPLSGLMVVPVEGAEATLADILHPDLAHAAAELWVEKDANPAVPIARTAAIRGEGGVARPVRIVLRPVGGGAGESLRHLVLLEAPPEDGGAAAAAAEDEIAGADALSVHAGPADICMTDEIAGDAFAPASYGAAGASTAPSSVVMDDPRQNGAAAPGAVDVGIGAGVAEAGGDSLAPVLPGLTQDNAPSATSSAVAADPAAEAALQAEGREMITSSLIGGVEALQKAALNMPGVAESLAATDVAILFLDGAARVRCFTPPMQRLMALTDEDVGRPICHVVSHIAGLDLVEETPKVMAGGPASEREVRLHADGSTFLMRLSRYHAASHEVDGIVAVFVEVTAFKQAHDRMDAMNTALEAELAALQTVLDLAPISIAISDAPFSQRVHLNAYGQKMLGLGSQFGPPRSPVGPYMLLKDGRELRPDELPSAEAWRTGRVAQDMQARYVGPGGNFDVLLSAAPVLSRSGETKRVIAVARDISALTQAQAVAEQRAEQHAYVARLGGRSLAGMPPEAMIAELPERLATLLKCEYAKFIKVVPASNTLELVAKFGFSAELGTIVEGGRGSQAGYTLSVQEAVVVTDLATDARFDKPRLLTDEGIVSGMSVIVGAPEEPFGVIGVHSRRRRTFSKRDAAFLQSAANVLAAALRRDAADRQRRILVDELQHRVKNTLATVQSVIRLTLRDAPMPPEVADRLMRRVRALALAHDINVSRRDAAVDLAELIRVQTRPFDQEEQVIAITGSCRVPLPPGLAIDVSMVIHELATNAAKHGALAHDGTVAITLSGETEGDFVRLCVDWREPGIQPAGDLQEGGGSRLMRAIAGRPEIEIERSWSDEGYRCVVTIAFEDERSAKVRIA